jgi:hypothetical protein
MFETIFKGLTGRWGILALLVAMTPTGRKFAKAAAREAIRAGIVATDKVKEIAAEIKEESGDIVAELREERARTIEANGLGNNGKTKTHKETADS